MMIFVVLLIKRATVAEKYTKNWDLITTKVRVSLCLLFFLQVSQLIFVKFETLIICYSTHPIIFSGKIENNVLIGSKPVTQLFVLAM